MDNLNIRETLNFILTLQKKASCSDACQEGCTRPFLGPNATLTCYNTRPVQLYNCCTGTPWTFNYTLDDGSTGSTSYLRVESLDETYNKNNLLISKQKYEPKQENIFKTDDDEFDYFGNCFYPQISGLKNSLIQERINKELKSLTIDTGFYTEFTVNSNFGNTLSITISKLVDKDSFENTYT